MQEFWARLIIVAGYASVVLAGAVMLVTIVLSFMGRVRSGTQFRMPMRLMWLIYLAIALLALGHLLEGRPSG